MPRQPAPSSARRQVAATLSVLIAPMIVAFGPVSTTASATPVDLDTLPALAQAQKYFPQADAEDRQGYSSLGVWFPPCADDGGHEPGAEPRHVWTAAYFDSDGAAKAVTADATLYPFSSKAKAKKVMRQLRAHVTGCIGLRTGVEDYSRYRLLDAPAKLGDDRLGFQWHHSYEFEDNVTRHHDVWARVGRTIAVTSAHRDRGPVPERSTNSFARLLTNRLR